MGVLPTSFKHLSGAMEDYQHGVMSGADNNIEKLTGKTNERRRLRTRPTWIN